MPIDYSKYPPNWKSEIVPYVINRANNKCEFCGVENYATVTSIPMRVCIEGRYKIKRFWLSRNSDIKRMKPYAQGGNVKDVEVVLTVAHLDHDETNHNVDMRRLAALCQYCHLNYDSAEKYRRACAK